MILVKIWSIKKEHLQNAVKTTFQRYSLIWRRRGRMKSSHVESLSNKMLIYQPFIFFYTTLD